MGFRPATRIEPRTSQNLEVSELVNLAQRAINRWKDTFGQPLRTIGPQMAPTI
jgi:hypothetical protein